MDDHLSRKKQLYDTLSDRESEDELDTGRQASEEALKKSRPNKRLQPSNHRSLLRTVSETAVTLIKEGQRGDLPAAPSPTDPYNQFNPNLFPGIKNTVGNIRPPGAQPPEAPAPRPGSKRKREPSFKSIPIERQVFRDLHFYFFPNNQSAPARRMRITKACEYGATWHKDWNAAVTHVVMDKNMVYTQLTDWIKIKEFPENVSIVNESWPAECITYGIVLDSKQARFSVKGLLAPIVVTGNSRLPKADPQMKPAGKSKSIAIFDEEERPAVAAPGRTGRDDYALQKAQETKHDSELDRAIEKAKALGDVTLDDDQEGCYSRPGSSGSSDQEGSLELQPPVKPKDKLARPQDKWQCMQKNTGENSGNPNAATIAILQQMADYYDQIGDEWRTRAYRKAIATLRNHDRKIHTKEQAAALPNVGLRLAEKIEEIAVTNHLRRLDNAKEEPTDRILQTFMGVYGAGIKQANEWIQMGFQTLDDLLERANLTTNQRIGIEHYEDFQHRIPRSEVEQHGRIVRDAVQKIDPAFEIIIGGSYRRGAESSGDIDCIITRPDTGAAHLRNVVLGQVVPQLTAQGFLVASLAATSRDDGSKWHGASCLPGSSTWRRLDLLLVPSDEFGAAIIYFTGDSIFNRSMRLLASTKGMRLNQRGLYRDVIRGKGRQKLSEGILVEGKDEKKIFEALGVPWRPPEHRIC
jgi:DNA polymerase IV